VIAVYYNTIYPSLQYYRRQCMLQLGADSHQNVDGENKFVNKEH